MVLLVAGLLLVTGIVRTIGRAGHPRRLVEHGITNIQTLLSLWDQQQSPDIRPAIRAFADAIGFENFAGRLPMLAGSLGSHLFDVLLDVCDDVGMSILEDPQPDGGEVVTVYDARKQGSGPFYAHIEKADPGLVDRYEQRMANFVEEEQRVLRQLSPAARAA
jgi:hypothetical protein